IDTPGQEQLSVELYSKYGEAARRARARRRADSPSGRGAPRLGLVPGGTRSAGFVLVGAGTVVRFGSRLLVWLLADSLSGRGAAWPGLVPGGT
ncbi:hypothetical protein, partial [Frankia nepalensis]|uniref:hypothetical protein n=1 Tax=Frankia nepalensis TaxID=1836974 RepID=UPI001EE4A020